MITRLGRKLILSALVIVLLISACATPADTLEDPTDQPGTLAPISTPTLTAEEAELIEEQAYFDEYGLVFLATEDEASPVLAISGEGEMLLPVLPQGGDDSTQILDKVIWTGPDGSSMLVTTSEDNLPEKMFFGEYTVLFSNYKEDTVTMAVLVGSETVEIIRDVPWDPVLWAEFQQAIAYFPSSSARQAKILPIIVSPEITLSETLAIAGYIVALSGCVFALAFAPTAAAAAVPCASTFLKAVKLVTGEDLKIFGVPIPSIITEAVECGSGEPENCVGLLLSGIEWIVEKFEEQEEENSETYETVREEINQPYCLTWWAYAEQASTYCGYCAEASNQETAKTSALNGCASSCGGGCKITTVECSQWGQP